MVKNGWYYHKCGQKIFKVLPETVLLNHVTYCKRCKTEQKVSIYCGKEIDKYAIKIAQSNYPDIIEMGNAFDVRNDEWHLDIN